MEQDPKAGVKYDAGKLPIATILSQFPRALCMIAEVGTFGAKKYTMGGWRTVPNGCDRYTNAMFRHWLMECKNEIVDDDSGLLHAAHLAWNALARLELIAQEMEQYDRCPDSRSTETQPPCQMSIEGYSRSR